SDVFRVDELPARVAAAAPAPLVLTPRHPAASLPLDPAVAGAVTAAVVTHAAVLIHGLPVTDAAAVAGLADQVFAGESLFSTGEHPQTDDHTALYRPVRYAPTETLLWHHENSFNADWPQYIMFACAIPAADGGETTIVDSRLVYAQMPPQVREPLARHGIRYERLCDGRTSRTWDQIYGTADRDEAQRQADANGEERPFAAA